MKNMNKTKMICHLGVGTALYIVVSMLIKIPIGIGNIWTDPGYIVFGVYCCMFGWYGLFVGALGCLIENLLMRGWISYSWIAGQIIIGAMCGLAYTKCKSKLIKIFATILAVFIGIGLVKTIIECVLYQIPFSVKFVKNFAGFVVDVVPMIIGLFIGELLKKKNIESEE